MFKTAPKTKRFLILIIGLLFTVFFQIFQILYYRQSTSRNENVPTFSDVKSDLKTKRKDHTKREIYEVRLKIIHALKRSLSKFEEAIMNKNRPESFQGSLESQLKTWRQNCHFRLEKYNRNARKLSQETFIEWKLPYQLNPTLCNTLK